MPGRQRLRGGIGDAPASTVRRRWLPSGRVRAMSPRSTRFRALTRQPEVAEAFFAELGQAAGADRRLDQAVARLRKELSGPSEARAPPARRGPGARSPGRPARPSRGSRGGRCVCRVPAGRLGRSLGLGHAFALADGNRHRRDHQPCPSRPCDVPARHHRRAISRTDPGNTGRTKYVSFYDLAITEGHSVPKNGGTEVTSKEVYGETLTPQGP